MKRGKKYLEAAKAIDRATLYDTEEAISLAKKAAVAKFDETIEVHIRTGCDGRHAEQQIRELLFYHTEQVRQLRFWFLQREPKLMRLRQQAQITLAAKN